MAPEFWAAYFQQNNALDGKFWALAEMLIFWRSKMRFTEYSEQALSKYILKGNVAYFNSDVEPIDDVSPKVNLAPLRGGCTQGFAPALTKFCVKWCKNKYIRSMGHDGGHQL